MFITIVTLIVFDIIVVDKKMRHKFRIQYLEKSNKQIIKVFIFIFFVN